MSVASELHEKDFIDNCASRWRLMEYSINELIMFTKSYIARCEDMEFVNYKDRASIFTLRSLLKTAASVSRNAIEYLESGNDE